ncbi:MAG: hypothetical protein WC076_02260 [Terrimicrobiaceae bacterium]|nr:hypothetical protein [Terrimicrobiaceae bacterium]
MKAVIGTLAACIGVFSAFLLQQALPAIHVFHGARFVFVPMIFCYAAMGLPFPAMLFVAFCTGLLSDLMYLHVVGGRVEIALGCSIVFFVIYGSIANGFRPSYLRGHWWPVIPLGVICTWAFLLMQFAMISLRREEFVFDEAILWRLLAPGLLAGLFVPILHAAVKPFAALIPENPRHAGKY